MKQKLFFIFALLLVSVLWVHGPAQASPFDYVYFNANGEAPHAYSTFQGESSMFYSSHIIGFYAYNQYESSTSMATASTDLWVQPNGHMTAISTTVSSPTDEHGFKIDNAFILDSYYFYYPLPDGVEPPEGFVKDPGYGWGTQKLNTHGAFIIDPIVFGGAGVPLHLVITPTFFGESDFFADLDWELTINGVTVSDPFETTIIQVMSGDLIGYSFNYNITTKQYIGGEGTGEYYYPSPYAINGGFSLDFSCQAVPIPGAALLLGSGLLGLAGLRKKLK